MKIGKRSILESLLKKTEKLKQDMTHSQNMYIHRKGQLSHACKKFTKKPRGYWAMMLQTTSTFLLFHRVNVVLK
ncbi:hypothetical protein BK651_26840 [Pseudomonas rhodesiae]|nr:hypothetical protein BK650_23955 [Pseudomonas rhodesiae]ROM59256.1 hypothetical protein BK651_26840 [Pseudomonas rhodesiae]